ncbi:hypothetical protein IJI55_01235 [Candidatus Saccharibacteria bacterium]|nr:hypothetical protein [Candidatus Saccharibacteria bacterium]
MERKKSNNKVIKIIVGVAVAVALLAGTAVVAFKLGEQHEKKMIADKVAALAEHIQEKVDVIAKFADVTKIWDANTDTIDKDGIKNYIEKLKGVINETNNGQIKEKLTQYLEKWQALDNIYEGKDNEQIMKAFDDIKASATETAQQIKDILDGNIKKTVKELDEIKF